MHTFLLRVGLVGQNSSDTVDKVKQLLKETLKKDFNNSNRVLKERMDHNLVNIFGLVGQNSTDTVDKVKQLLKETLKKDFNNSSRVLKERMDHNLVNIFGSDAHFQLRVNAMWNVGGVVYPPKKKSFFVSILVKDKEHIIITAKYKEIKNLKGLSAMVVARCLKEKEDVDKLENVPKCLFDDIKEFCDF
eukprot:GFUD01036163.1.p1 GENE.GFUD01036163.1~~GFUD01036163.1.p1  ORF type:complete len:189 (-),score=67.83 GFUD01036163.1:58-624(-)